MKGKPKKVKVRGAVRWYVDAIDPLTGRRRRAFFATKAEADAHQDRVNHQPKPTRTLHALVDPDVTVAAFAADYYWTSVAAGAWRPATARVFADHMNNRILNFRFGTGPADTLGALRMRDVTRHHVEACITGLRQRLAPRTVRDAFRLLRVLLDRAHHRGLLPVHPIDRTLQGELRPLLKPKKGAPKALTIEQTQQFLATAAAHSTLHDLYVTGFATGCRLGELCGLQFADDVVSIVGGTKVRQLRIERSLDGQCSMLHPMPGPTKTGATRHVDVAAPIGALLDRLRAERPALALQYCWGKPLPAWVFVTSGGVPVAQSFVRRDFSRILRLAKLPPTFSPHSMRHTWACTSIALGRSVKYLQQQLGHASASVTLDTYGGWFQVREVDAADALANAVLGNPAGNRTRS